MNDTNQKQNKPMTLDDLAVKMDKGFADVTKKFEGIDQQFDDLAVMINRAFQDQKDHFDKEIARLEGKIDALAAKLTAHLELSDKRYLELKRRDVVIAKWLQKIADKTGVKIDLAELEKF